MISREHAVELDRNDLLAKHRDDFLLPEGVIYLDGNSLGPPPRATEAGVLRVVREQWSADLVGSWNRHGWIDLAETVARAIAPLIGAGPDEVMVADSTSVNLFKLLAAALRINPGRRVILSERENFPTDLYMAQGLADLLGDIVDLRLVDRSQIESALGSDVAVVMLTHVDFRSGEMRSLEDVTARVHESGALMLWDLAHSAGAVPVNLDVSRADLAVGCGYKYLNGGPGAPAFAFVARRHHPGFASPLWGWMGHDAPFDFSTEYRPAAGVKGVQVGTPPILSLAALECGVEAVAGIGIDWLHAKSVRMTELFIDLVDERCAGMGFEIASPRDPGLRGSHVALRHAEAYAITQALIADRVVGDFRSPDLLRFGFAPAYLRFVDVWDAVDGLRRIMEEGEWDRPRYRVREKVT